MKTRPSAFAMLAFSAMLALACGGPQAVRGNQVPGLDQEAMSTGLDKRDLQQALHENMKALQEGVTYTDYKGRTFSRKAFDQGYFPASRLVSTFPSASDVAWTEILGNRPLPGYQRTYFSHAANAEIFVNGVTSSMEYERQMTWQVESGIQRGRGYVFPVHTYRYELRKLMQDFLNTNDGRENYYALIRATDDGQHLGGIHGGPSSRFGRWGQTDAGTASTTRMV